MDVTGIGLLKTIDKVFTDSVFISNQQVCGDPARKLAMLVVDHVCKIDGEKREIYIWTGEVTDVLLVLVFCIFCLV